MMEIQRKLRRPTPVHRGCLRTWFAVLMLVAGLVGAQRAGADTNLLDNIQGSDILGIEGLQLVVLLAPTADAPALSGGLATLDGSSDNGTNATALDIETVGLADGTYTVGITRKSDGSTVFLGTFDLSSADLGGDNDIDGDLWGDDDNDPQDDGSGSSTNGVGSTSVEFGGGAGIPLPDGFDPMDIAAVTVTGTNGVVMLQGDAMDLSQLVTAVFDAVVSLDPGSAAPDVQGQATLHSSVKRRVRKTRFALNAQNVPPNAVLALDINGSNYGTVKSNSRGQLRLRRLPPGVDPSTLTTLELLDSQHNLVLSARF